MTSAVYKIRNIINDHYYIGSSVQCEKRWQVHRRMLNAGKHHNEPLQRAWHKYGDDVFVFEIVMMCDRNELKIVEGRMLSESFGTDACYNTSLDPLAPTRGIKRSQETRDRISESLTGKRQTESERLANQQRQLQWNETRRMKNEDHPNKGRKMSSEQRELLRQQNIGRSISDTAKSMLLDYAKRPKSEEHRRKIAEGVRRAKAKLLMQDDK